jgi:hypothetical protein
VHYNCNLLHTPTKARNLCNINYRSFICINPPTCFSDDKVPVSCCVSVHITGSWSFWIENFDPDYLYAYNHMQYKQWLISILYSRICRHENILTSTYLYLFLAVIIILIPFYRCLSEDGDLSLKHVEEFMCVCGWFVVLYSWCMCMIILNQVFWPLGQCFNPAHPGCYSFDRSDRCILVPGDMATHSLASENATDFLFL